MKLYSASVRPPRILEASLLKPHFRLRFPLVQFTCHTETYESKGSSGGCIYSLESGEHWERYRVELHIKTNRAVTTTGGIVLTPRSTNGGRDARLFSLLCSIIMLQFHYIEGGVFYADDYAY